MKEHQHAVFVYGTLKDPEIRKMLFGESIASELAVLEGYAIKESGDFFFITPQAGRSVQGVVIRLTDRQLMIADQWEEIPFYAREEVGVRVNSQKRQAWAYVRNDVNGRDADPGQISAIDKAVVIEMVESFNRQLALNSLPFCDAYLLIPCIAGPVRSQLTEAGDDAKFESCFIGKLKEVSCIEFCGSLSRQIRRSRLPQVEVAAYSNDDRTLLGYERASLIVSEFGETGFAVVDLIIPAVSVPLLYLLDQASSGRIRVRESEADGFIPIEDYLLSKGLSASGTVRTALFMKRKPSDGDFISALICEVESPAEVTGRSINESIHENVAQYSSAEVYASDICVLEIPRSFDLLYENRLNSQLLTLFIIEIIQLQEAALKKVSRDIQLMISGKTYESDLEAMEKIEKVTEEYSRAMLLWDINNFRYRTAQTLADEFFRKFRMEKRFNVFFQYKDLIEQLTQVHSNRINIADSKMLNRILLLLAFIQVIPIINSIYRTLFTSSISTFDLYSTLTSVVSCFFIWLVFKLVNRKSPKKRLFKM